MLSLDYLSRVQRTKKINHYKLTEDTKDFGYNIEQQFLYNDKLYFINYPSDKTIYVDYNKALTEARHGLPQVCDGLTLRARDRDGTPFIYNKKYIYIETGIVRIYNKNKLKYNGKIVNGKISGRGHFYYDNGQNEYIGFLKNGYPINKGVYYHKSGIAKLSFNKEKCEIYYDKLINNNPIIHYSGILKNKKFNGNSKVYYNNGIIGYSGDLYDNIPNGIGKYFYDNGVLAYHGNFVHGQLTGIGIFYLPTGKIYYEGQFKNDKCPGMFFNFKKKIDFYYLFFSKRHVVLTKYNDYK